MSEQTIKPPETCPRCASPVGHSIGDIGIQFKCGTIQLATGGYSEALPCVMRQRDQFATKVDTLRTANAALMERVKRLEAAGDELCKASKVFLIQEVELTDDDETMTPIDKVAPSMVFAWEEPPNSGEHVRLMRAIEQWDDATKSNP